MILILTAGYGEGHNAAARGLHAAFSQMGKESKIIDAFALSGDPTYDPSRKAYIELINRAPLVWAAIFWLIDRLPIVPWSLPFLGKVQVALGKVIAEHKPDAIISVYPVYGYMLDRLFAKTPRPFSTHTVVTDSITVNSVWFKCASDTFLVANQDTASVMSAAGVPAEKLHVLGFPVPPIFAKERSPRPYPEPGKARVLFMINAGKSMAPAIVSELLALEGIALTVTVGRDEILRAKIEAAAAGRPIEIFGWTDQMPHLLMSHHLLIGKAGGAAVQEAIAARTPMLITHVVPGQEEGNARLMVTNQCGAICTTPKALADKTARLFADGAQEWRAWEENIGRLSRPDAALRIADFVSS